MSQEQEPESPAPEPPATDSRPGSEAPPGERGTPQPRSPGHARDAGSPELPAPEPEAAAPTVSDRPPEVAAAGAPSTPEPTTAGGGQPESAAVRLLRSFPPIAGLPGPVVALVGVGVAAFALLVLLDAASLVLGVVATGLGDFLTVLLVAMIAAYLLDPVIDRFEGRGWKRTPAIVVCLAMSLLLGAAATLLMIPYVVTELADLGTNLDRWAQDFGAQMARAEVWVESRIGREVPADWAAMAENLPKLLDRIPAGALDPLGSAAQAAVGWFGGLLGFVVHWALFPIFTFYFLRDFDRLKESAIDVVPLRWRPALVEQGRAIDSKIASFLRGQFLLCCVLALLYALGLGLLTEVPLAVLIGVLAGLLFIIPYFGTFVGIVLGTFLAFAEFGVSWEILKVWAVFGAVQALEGTVLTPKIVGESVGLHPVVVMLALVIGANLFGFLGILVAVPAAAALQVVLGTLVRRYRSTGWFAAKAADPAGPGVDP